MRFSHIFSGLLAFTLGASAAPSRPQKPSHSLLQWTPPPPVPELDPAIQAKIDWDLDNVSTSFDTCQLSYLPVFP